MHRCRRKSGFNIPITGEHATFHVDRLQGKIPLPSVSCCIGLRPRVARRAARSCREFGGNDAPKLSRETRSISGEWFRAAFYFGDGHAAMGDGECRTAIEVPMKARLQFNCEGKAYELAGFENEKEIMASGAYRRGRALRIAYTELGLDPRRLRPLELGCLRAAFGSGQAMLRKWWIRTTW